MVPVKRTMAPAGSTNNTKRLTAGGSSTKMKVYVRVRPYNEKEVQGDLRNIVRILDDQVLVFDPKENDQPFFFHGVKQKMRDIAKKQNKEMQFIFDGVYGDSSTNQDVYDGSIKSLLPRLLEGYNCSVFVYGATGAGKTFTMVGNSESPGITYLTMLELYSQMEALQDTKKFELRISYLEVYNENVHDLLNPGSGALHLREDPVNGVIVANMKLENVTSAEHLLDLLQRGNANRTQHPTDANAESSRSHAVFQVFIRVQNRDSEVVKFVKLTMIDLAGSERGAATHCKGIRFKEGSNINKSLLALGNCINNLADGVRHIPYRDSKLTRLLKDSLGGNCQTIMIACVGPTTLSYEDTYNTLKYATRAKNIKTTLSKNMMLVDTHVDQLKQIIKELQGRVEEKEKCIEESKKTISKLEAENKSKAKHALSNLTAWKEKINKCFAEKKKLHEEFLTLECKEKDITYAIKNKHIIGDRIEVFQGEEFKIQDLDKIENAVHQLQGRILGLRRRMLQIWDEKIENDSCIAALRAEMVKQGVAEFLEADIASKEYEIKYVERMMQDNHRAQLLLWTGVLNDKQEHIIKKIASQNKQYHTLLVGYNKMTDAMKEQHNDVQGLAKRHWGVSWEVSPNNQIKKKQDSLEPYATLSLDALHECRKPVFLELANIEEHLKLPSSEDTNEEEEEEEEEDERNLSYTLPKPKPVAPTAAFPIKRKSLKFKPNSTPFRKPLRDPFARTPLKSGRAVSIPAKRTAATSVGSSVSTPTFQLPKRPRTISSNKENQQGYSKH